MATNADLMRVKENMFFRGFVNLLHKENRAWWRTRKGWLNALLWPLMLGGLVAFLAFVMPEMTEQLGDPVAATYGGRAAFGLSIGLSAFFEMGTLAISLGIIVLCQDLIIGEKQSGVAEWLLSKPIARRSYILAKITSNMVPMLVLMISLPSATVYWLISLRTGNVYPLEPFVIGVGIMAVHSLFYLALTILAGTLFESRALILAVPLGSLFGGSILMGIWDPLMTMTPWALAKSASAAAAGAALPVELLNSPVAATLIWMLIFIGIAIVRFERTEF